MNLIDWNKFREKITLSAGTELDIYGDLFSLKRFSFELCEDFRKRVLFLFDEQMKYLHWGLQCQSKKQVH